MAEDKQKSLEEAFKQIEKQFGKGSVMKLGDKVYEKMEVIPTGSIALDNALGVGGYPKGRIIEIFGPESSGKTTFALHAIAEAQKQGGYAAFIDAEHALDPIYAKNLGVDIFLDARNSLNSFWNIAAHGLLFSDAVVVVGKNRCKSLCDSCSYFIHCGHFPQESARRPPCSSALS